MTLLYKLQLELAKLLGQVVVLQELVWVLMAVVMVLGLKHQRLQRVMASLNLVWVRSPEMGMASLVRMEL